MTDNIDENTTVTPVVIKIPEESWIKQYWRPVMAWQYLTVCLFDFIIAPILTMIFFHMNGGDYVAWDPITLKEGGFYHLSMAAIVGVAAWTRGQEKITRINAYGEEVSNVTETTGQTPLSKKPSKRGRS